MESLQKLLGSKNLDKNIKKIMKIVDEKMNQYNGFIFDPKYTEIIVGFSGVPVNIRKQCVKLEGSVDNVNFRACFEFVWDDPCIIYAYGYVNITFNGEQITIAVYGTPLKEVKE